VGQSFLNRAIKEGLMEEVVTLKLDNWVRFTAWGWGKMHKFHLAFTSPVLIQVGTMEAGAASCPCIVEAGVVEIANEAAPFTRLCLSTHSD
jgi:hypothetical protein